MVRRVRLDCEVPVVDGRQIEADAEGRQRREAARTAAWLSEVDAVSGETREARYARERAEREAIAKDWIPLRDQTVALLRAEIKLDLVEMEKRINERIDTRLVHR